MTKPGSAKWPAAVARAVELLRKNPLDSLYNSCQHVPIKYLAALRQQAQEQLAVMRAGN